jgi:hypothetical protein
MVLPSGCAVPLLSRGSRTWWWLLPGLLTLTLILQYRENLGLAFHREVEVKEQVLDTDSFKFRRKLLEARGHIYEPH